MGRGGGRGMDDHASAASVLGRGRGRRGHGRGAFLKSSSSSGHKEDVGGTPLLQAITEAMTDVARAICDEIPPPLLHSPRRETSPNPIEAKFRCYMKDFKRCNLPMFSGRSDVMIAEDWLQWINRIFTIVRLKDDTIQINVAIFQFTGKAIH